MKLERAIAVVRDMRLQRRYRSGSIERRGAKSWRLRYYVDGQRLEKTVQAASEEGAHQQLVAWSRLVRQRLHFAQVRSTFVEPPQPPKERQPPKVWDRLAKRAYAKSYNAKERILAKAMKALLKEQGISIDEFCGGS